MTLGAEGADQGAHAVEVHAELLRDGWEGTLLHKMGPEDFIVLVPGLCRFGEEALAERISHNRDSCGGYFRVGEAAGEIG